MSKEKNLAVGCAKNKATVQKEVFEQYAPLLRGICYRYASNEAEGEDILQDSFVKIFTKIKSFKWNGAGSFEKWMRRVVVNTAIDFYNKNKRIQFVDIDTADQAGYLLDDSTFVDLLYNDFSEEELINALNLVTEKFRIVFNLYVVEGYRHREIAELLNIDEQTSRSRLKRAKAQLRAIVANMCEETIKTVV